MSYDEHLAARIRAALAGRSNVKEQKMMGSLAFMVSGSMCCTAGPDGLLVRVLPASREALLKDPQVTPMTMGARTMKGFVRVAGAACRSDAELVAWIERGIAAGASAKPSRRRR